MLKACSAATDAVVDTDMKMDDQKVQPVYDEAWANDIYANKDQWPMVIFDKKPDGPTPAAEDFKDQFVDLVLREVNKEIPAKEKLPDESLKFKSAVIRLYDGYLSGINTLRRVGQAAGSIHEDTIDLDFDAKFGPLYGHYAVEVISFFLIVVGSATICVRDIDLKVKVSGTLGKPAQLQELKISHVAVPVIHISGLGPFGRMLDYLLNFLAAAVSSWIGRWLQGPLKKFIQKKLDEHPLPNL